MVTSEMIRGATGVTQRNMPGRLIVVSGPSGSGKSTLVRRLLRHSELKLRLSVSATTRKPRPGEVHGKDYYFLTRPEFEAGRHRGEFLEWAEVHGNLYGTPLEPVRQSLQDGWCVILEIDVQGALLVRKSLPDALLIFIDVPGIAALEARLRARATDDEATIVRRLEAARRELEQADHYDVRVLNETLDQAETDLVALLIQHGCQAGGPAAGRAPDTR